MTKHLKAFATIIGSLIIVTVLCNIIVSIYSHSPYWFNRNTNATSSIWRPGAFILQNKEGSGYYIIDKNGYVNDNLPLSGGGYVLVLGASHSQGKEVANGERYSDILNNYLSTSKEELVVYNMAADGHYYDRLVSGFEAAIEEFPNSSAVIIEIGPTDYSYEELESALTAREFDLAKTGAELLKSMTLVDKIKAFIKEYIPIANIIKDQIESINFNFDGAFGLFKSNREEKKNEVVFDYVKYYEAVKNTAELMSNNYDGTIIVLYHPTMDLCDDGSIRWNISETYEPFKSAIEDSGIIFLNVQNAFQEAYNNDHVVPYGFNNTHPGSGHLNKYGHQIIADELYSVLEEIC